MFEGAETMENLVARFYHIHSYGRITQPWKSKETKSSNFVFLKPLFTKPLTKFPSLTTQTLLASVERSSTYTVSDIDSVKHKTLLVETYHEHRRLKILLDKLEKKGSNPLQILREDGDWSKDHFWAVVRFLKNASRSKEILQVFDMWKNIEESRICEFNYDKIIYLLSEEGMVEDAVSALKEMKNEGLRPSLGTYNPIVHGFSREGNFNEALNLISEMKEYGLVPDSETYDGLIQAYGKFKMYDELGLCVKMMELDGCSLDHVTCNILIREYSRGGLLQRMEKVYQRMMSKRMHLQSSTKVAVLEAYARFGLIDKMEKFYRMLLNSKAPLKDDLIRKLAEVYIGNYMYSRLEDLGLALRANFGSSDLVWCLRLLSCACLSSRKGMSIIVREMRESNISWNITVANIIMLAYVKMKDFSRLRNLLSELRSHRVEPDIVTIGILFDASRIGFDGSATLDTWRRMGYLYRDVEMKTDPLVLTAFGKGYFLKSCEEVYSSLYPQDRESETWTYQVLIDLVSKHSKIHLSCITPN
ncbi:hypothetical protein L6164_025276 [Bauhinia variegata]|uniref:Uncharacterized protein n=1 Tax=Bauhinia variegata TaxID=167791 RepID=A0ACB9M031_BAUVA|nr:hypothetical protein L6164_025276 [Bauhinia variegata]